MSNIPGMRFDWKFLQDQDGDLEEKLIERGFLYTRSINNGYLIACDKESNVPVHWYEVPDITSGEVFGGD